MTLRLIEGFDHFNTTTLAALKGWQFLNNTGGSPVTWVAGRLNGNAVKITGVNSLSDISLTKFLPVTASTVVAGFAVRPVSFPMSQLVLLVSSTGAPILVLGFDSAGRLQIKNSGLTVIATGTTLFATGAWFYVEVKAVVAGASGSVSAQVNGGAEIAATTASIGTTAVGGIMLRTIDLTSASFDDLYVCDTAGTENNSFLGDRHVDTLFPTADGTHTDMAPDSGTAHYSRVNETSPDGDSSYVATNVLNAIDSYQVGSVSVPTADVRGIQTNLWARKDDAALRQVAPLIRVATTDYPGSTQTLAATYVDYTQIYEQNPGTSADWTVPDIDAAEYGVKVVT